MRDRLIAREFERRVTASQAREHMASHDAGVSPEPVARDAAESVGAGLAAGCRVGGDGGKSAAVE